MSIKEKLALQKLIRENKAKLQGGGLDVKAKLAIQKETREALTKLGNAVKAAAESRELTILQKLEKALPEIKFTSDYYDDEFGQYFSIKASPRGLSYDSDNERDDGKMVRAFLSEDEKKLHVLTETGTPHVDQKTKEHLNLSVESASHIIADFIGTSVESTSESKDIDVKETPVLDSLSSGEFDDLELPEYIDKLRLAHQEINEIDSLIPHAERYAEKNSPETLEAITESFKDFKVEEDDNEGKKTGLEKIEEATKFKIDQKLTFKGVIDKVEKTGSIGEDKFPFLFTVLVEGLKNPEIYVVGEKQDSLTIGEEISLTGKVSQATEKKDDQDYFTINIETSGKDWKSRNIWAEEGELITAIELSKKTKKMQESSTDEKPKKDKAEDGKIEENADESWDAEDPDMEIITESAHKAAEDGTITTKSGEYTPVIPQETT